VRGCVEKALGEVALTPSQYFVLFLVETGEATSAAELARATANAAAVDDGADLAARETRAHRAHARQHQQPASCASGHGAAGVF
jgi:hypothetical protein